MKVRVTYTVDHEEVPKLIDELVADCRASLRELSNFKFDVRSLEQASDDVKNVQNRLDTVAGKLEDCFNLCLGYDSVVNPPPMEPVEEEPPNE